VPSGTAQRPCWWRGITSPRRQGQHPVNCGRPGQLPQVRLRRLPEQSRAAARPDRKFVRRLTPRSSNRRCPRFQPREWRSSQCHPSSRTPRARWAGHRPANATPSQRQNRLMRAIKPGEDSGQPGAYSAISFPRPGTRCRAA
jgi:hypothetical protein